MKSIDNAVCIGQHIDERYELKRLLELRTNTNIYVAFDIYRQRPVLLRLFFWDFTYSVANPEEFLNIALSVSHLAQPEHLKIISCGKTHDGMLYTVWPYENIESVSKLIHINGPFETGVALSICRDIASTLENVYRQTGVGHYNLNTNKLYINSNGDVRLSDLGHAAYLLNDDQFAHEESPYFNERFLAPEITLDDCPPNIQSDMFSMGACLYNMITGKRPFDNLQYISPEDYEDLKLPTSLEVRLGKDICSFIYKMLSPNPKNRFASWLDVLKALNHCLKLDFIVDTRSRKTSLTTIFTDGFILENLTKETEESDIEETQVLSASDVSSAVKATKPAPYIFPKKENHLFRNLAIAAVLSFSFTVFYLYSTNKDIFQTGNTTLAKATTEPVEIQSNTPTNTTSSKGSLTSRIHSNKQQHQLIVKDVGLQKMKVKEYENTPRQQFQEIKFQVRDLTLKKDWDRALAVVNTYKGPYQYERYELKKEIKRRRSMPQEVAVVIPRNKNKKGFFDDIPLTVAAHPGHMNELDLEKEHLGNEDLHLKKMSLLIKSLVKADLENSHAIISSIEDKNKIDLSFFKDVLKSSTPITLNKMIAVGYKSEFGNKLELELNDGTKFSGTLIFLDSSSNQLTFSTDKSSLNTTISMNEISYKDNYSRLFTKDPETKALLQIIYLLNNQDSKMALKLIKEDYDGPLRKELEREIKKLP